MSNVSNTHNIVKLDKNSKALSGQRMSRVIAKKDKDGAYQSEHLNESKFVSLPTIVPEFTEAQVSALAPHIVGLLADAQDQIIRDRIITDGITSVHDDEISIDKCIAYLDDAAKGNRVTGEYVAKWFTETYGESAIEFVAALCKFSVDDNLTEDQLKVIETKVNVLTSMFSGFASGKYSPDIPKCKAMGKFCEFVTEENMDARMLNYRDKAKSILEAKQAELSMDALGF